MKVKIKTGNPAAVRSACLVLGVFAKQQLGAAAAAVDAAADGQLRHMMKLAHLDGEPEQTLLLHGVPGCAAERILLVGCGKAKEFGMAEYKKAIAAAYAELARQRIGEAVWTLHDLPVGDPGLYRCVRETVLGFEDLAYRFDQLKSDPQAPPYPFKSLGVLVADKGARDTAQTALEHGRAIAGGVAWAKDLGNLPGNVCTPSYLADAAIRLGKDYDGLKVEVLEEKDIQALGMGALLAVSRGSRQPAKLIVMDYRGAGKKDKPVVLVGKGLTFDAGGISLKPGAAMDEMKYDMCGGATVFGVVRACAELKLAVNLIGVVPSSENLPDGDANKPGDVLTSMSGQTIEVLNTDAEGRLILCDALTYSERFEPDTVIDIATLTGACVIALGRHASGLFSKDDGLAAELATCGERIGDRVWRMPLWDDYQIQLKSPFADMANIGGREGGSITAACFLSRFTKKMRWAHLDIAGTAWLSGDKKGATGRPVPMLVQYLLQRSGVDR